MKILHVVGARPNLMKVAPVYLALERRDVQQILVHTGQHYDENMSEVFFRQLGLPKADINLEVGSGSHTWQTATVMLRLEPVLKEAAPDLALVYGDVNSTLAASLVCAKEKIRLGHVEAGLRSLDRSMPEEVNRLVTDSIADILFTPSQDGNENLAREGVAAEKVHLVGNVMIDTLIRLLPQARDLKNDLHGRLGLAGSYGLVTLHRPANVDNHARLSELLAALDEISRHLELIFPVHPRTRERLKSQDQALVAEWSRSGRIQVIDPLGYLEFLALMDGATLIITDSGGIQEETTYLGVPCLTLRQNTERPVTLELGSNRLIGNDLDLLRRSVEQILSGRGKASRIPPLWDGRAAERIADILLRDR